MHFEYSENEDFSLAVGRVEHRELCEHDGNRVLASNCKRLLQYQHLCKCCMCYTSVTISKTAVIPPKSLFLDDSLTSTSSGNSLSLFLGLKSPHTL